MSLIALLALAASLLHHVCGVEVARLDPERYAPTLPPPVFIIGVQKGYGCCLLCGDGA